MPVRDEAGRKAGAPQPATGQHAGRFNAGAMARNVLANWGGHAVAVAAGFILPRIINDQIGQVRLGLWDFGWSVASSFMLLTGGVGSAVNRYVARFRATRDWHALNRTISACMGLVLLSALLVGTISCVVALSVQTILPESLGPHSSEARWVVLLLGASMSVQISLAVYHGVITGYQRYDLAAWIETGCRIVGVALMIASLLLGYGLVALCVITVSRELVLGLLKHAFAHRLCPALAISVWQVKWAELRAVIVFGGKSYLFGLADIALYQFNRIILISYLGPAALALYSRPMGLVRSCQELVYHFARVVTPLASEIQGSQRSNELADLLLRTARYSVWITLPTVLFLSLYGAPILRVWMGEGYEAGEVVAILAVGHLTVLLQRGSYQILMGLNRHGLPAMAALFCACASVGMSLVSFSVLGLGIKAAALSVVVPLTLFQGIVVPFYAARVVGLPIRKYLSSMASALWPTLPFAAIISLIRIATSDESVQGLLVATVAGGFTLAVTYWVMVVPKAWKTRLRRRILALAASRVDESGS